MALEVRSRPGRGRGLYATRLIRAGEVVLDEPPLLLAVSPDHAGACCAACMRMVPSESALACGGCGQAVFCSAACQAGAGATPWVHGVGMCRAYAGIAASSACLEDQSSARFLAHALCLRDMAAHDPQQRYARLLELCGELRPRDMDDAARLMQLLAGALGGMPTVPQDEVAALLARESQNVYGILAPHVPGGPRVIRGGALYHQCSLINHECNPNIARFDSFDNSSGGRMCFRAMHDLPPGTELTQSYVPLNWAFEERQAQCRGVYGFACACARCQADVSGFMDLLTGDGDALELDVSDDDGAGAVAGGTGAGADASLGTSGGGSPADDVYTLPPNPEEGALDPTYLQLFLLKYVCPVPGCFGTMAPTNPDTWPNEAAYTYQCNVCSSQRSGADFLTELEHEHDSGHAVTTA